MGLLCSTHPTITAQNTKFNAGKRVFEQLANEEKKHLKLLAEHLKALKKTSL